MNRGVPVGNGAAWMKPDSSLRERVLAPRGENERQSVRIADRSGWTTQMVAGGQWRIRTSVGVSQLIYSQSRLAASVTAPVIAIHAYLVAL